MMATWDGAMGDTWSVRENRNTAPLQALSLMNDVSFLEASRFVGQRMMKEGGASTDARLAYGFRLVTGRTPSAAERQILRDSLQYHLDYFSDKKNDVKAFLNQGEARADDSLDGRELAAYTSVGSLLLNLDETVTKE